MFRKDEGESIDLSLDQLIAEISDSKYYGTTGVNEAVFQVSHLNEKQKEYVLKQMPSALESNTGKVNWHIIRALKTIEKSYGADDLRKQAKIRLTDEILSILDNGNPYALKKVLDEIKFTYAQKSVIVEKLIRIAQKESLPSDIRRSVKFKLKVDYGVTIE